MVNHNKADIRTKNPSAIIELIDDFTGENPVGKVTNIYLKENSTYQPILNNTGYYIFFNLPDGTYTLVIESEYYETQEESITIPFPKIEIPETINLIPLTSYPFPIGSTIIRGVVMDTNDIPIDNVKISFDLENIPSSNMEVWCKKNGDFIIYIPKKQNIVFQKKNDIMKLENMKFLLLNNTQLLPQPANFELAFRAFSEEKVQIRLS